VSRGEIARAAGVTTPAVHNWETRSKDFPRPDEDGGTPYYQLGAICEWLERRPVRANRRRPDEPKGATYGDRVRRYFREQDGGDLDGSVRAVSRDSEDILRRLLFLADRVPGASRADCLWLMLSLVFLRDEYGPGKWEQISSSVSRDVPSAFLRRIGNMVKDALRSRGVVSRRDGLTELRPQPVDLVEIVQLCGELDDESYPRLLEEYERAGRLDPAGFFTPDCLTRLVAPLVLPDDAPRIVFDPYARSGELLAAVADALGPGERTIFRGTTVDNDSAVLTCMRLVHCGISPELEVAGKYPWQEAVDEINADVVITNPRFNMTTTDADFDCQWEFGPPPRRSLNYAWLQHTLAYLKPGGRAAVVMPTGANSSADQVERNLRSAMTGFDAIEGVISLPSQLFPTSGAEVSVWLLRRPSGDDAGHRSPIFLIDARGARMKIGGKQRALTQEAQDGIVTAVTAWRENPDTWVEYPTESIRITSVHPDRIHHEPSCSLHPADYLTRQAQPRTAEERAESLATAVRRVAELVATTHRADYQVEGLDLPAFPVFSASLPSGWARQRLGELCAVQTGPAGGKLSNNTHLGPGGIPLVETAHLTHRRIKRPEKTVAPDLAGALPKHRLRPGDILCGRSGKPGNCALVTDIENDWIFGTNLLRLHRFAPGVDSRYLLAYLSMPAVEDWIRNRSNSTVPGVRAESLRQLTIVLPPLPVQERIGVAFAAMDDQLRSHQSLIEAIADARDAAADHIFGDNLAT
jgi:type I restriction enzyme M protein